MGKMLIVSFDDNEDEMIKLILSVLKAGRSVYVENTIQPYQICYGNIMISLDKREVFRNKKKVTLSFIEFEILQLLIQNPGRVFSKEQIYNTVWNEPYSGDYNIVTSHISHIREKIEDDPSNPIYIQTVWGVGYRFNNNLSSSE